MSSRGNTLAVVFALLLAPISRAHTDAALAPLHCATHPGVESAYHQKLRETVATLSRQKVFSGTVLVARPAGAALDLFGGGFAYSHDRCHIENTFDTQFRIGSVTKQFTAVAILQLVEKHKLQTNEPLWKALPGFPRAGNAAKITVRHLLTHTSGLPDYTEEGAVAGIREGMTPTQVTEAIVAAVRKRGARAPGKRFEYNNSNFVVLGRLVEIHSGLTFEAYVAKHLFVPAGMSHSGFGLLPKGTKQARGYESENGTLSRTVDKDTSAGGSGEIYSTAEDLLHWQQALHESTKLLGAKARQEMLKPHLGQYGYGISVRRVKVGSRVRTFIEHDGGMAGFSSWVSYLPKERISIILLSNVEDAPLEELKERLAFLALKND